MAAKTITFAVDDVLQGKIDATAVANGSVANNSTVTTKIYVRRTSGYTTGKTWHGNVNVNGVNHTYSQIYTGTSVRVETSWVLLQTYVDTVAHNSDGKKTITISGSVGGPDGTTLSDNTSSGSDTFVLDDIPRASQPTASNGTIGEVISVLTNRASTSFTHTLKATFGGTQDTIATNVGASFDWTPPLDYQNRIPSAQSGSCVITCETYSGATLIGTKTVTITLNIDEESCTPDLTGSYVDTNGDVSNVTGYLTTLIATLSNIIVTATPILKYGATVSDILIDGISVKSGGAPYRKTYNSVTAEHVDLTVVDSRGLSKDYTITLTYVYYSPITFLASFFRTAAASNEVALQFSGTFYNDTIGLTQNTIAARYRYQPELGEWSEWINLGVVIDGNNFSNEGTQVVLGSIFSRNSQYRFEVEFIDALDVKTSTVLVRTARTILKVTENCQVLQGKLHVQKLYTKNDKDFVFDFVYDIITRTWLVHVYGLTQMFEPQHIFQSDVNARSIITVLNTEEYPLLKYSMDDTSDNFKDYINVSEVAKYNNYTMIDTGICALQNMVEKRARELQFTTYSTNKDKLSFFVTAYIDSRNVSNPDNTTIDWISDPDDPNYGNLYEVEEEVANVYGETYLDAWIIDQSMFPKIGLIRSHLRLHGKGLYYRAVIINRDLVEYEISGIAWIYRIMNAR